MSASSAYNTAVTALSGGIIAAIVVGSVIGLALCIGFIICIYCICCRKPKQTSPGMIMQPQPYPYPPPSNYHNHAANRV